MNNANNTINQTSIIIAVSAGIALFWIIFLWGFFDREFLALGINTSIFLIAFLYATVKLGLRQRKFFAKENLAWIIPLLLIGTSFAIYDNIFIKGTNFLAIPIFTLIFLSFAVHKNHNTVRWGTKFIIYVIERAAQILGMIPKSVHSVIAILTPKENAKSNIVKRAVIGTILFIIIGVTIIIPLLGSADPAFSSLASSFYSWIGAFIDEQTFGKIIVFIILFIWIMSLISSFQKQVTEQGDEDNKTDSLIAGIVLAGILVLYIVFLYLQIERIWISDLPIDFKETESLVKSGFWQLFILTILNIGFFFGCYKKTNKKVQNILLGFTAASLLLLASAAWRMGLYVFFYGFSYQKFYASYTVIFCAILLFWLLWRMFKHERANLLKTTCFLLLWMYALIAVMPVEQFIFRANNALHTKEDSRINMYEMTMLSSDVLCLAEKSQIENPELFDGWDSWVEKKRNDIDEKKWYEMNVSNIFYISK